MKLSKLYNSPWYCLTGSAILLFSIYGAGVLTGMKYSLVQKNDKENLSDDDTLDN
jgi:hypothetical protein